MPARERGQGLPRTWQWVRALRGKDHSSSRIFCRVAGKKGAPGLCCSPPLTAPHSLKWALTLPHIGLPPAGLGASPASGLSPGPSALHTQETCAHRHTSLTDLNPGRWQWEGHLLPPPGQAFSWLLYHCYQSSVQRSLGLGVDAPYLPVFPLTRKQPDPEVQLCQVGWDTQLGRDPMHIWTGWKAPASGSEMICPLQSLRCSSPYQGRGDGCVLRPGTVYPELDTEASAGLERMATGGLPPCPDFLHLSPYGSPRSPPRSQAH